MDIPDKIGQATIIHYYFGLRLLFVGFSSSPKSLSFETIETRIL